MKKNPRDEWAIFGEATFPLSAAICYRQRTNFWRLPCYRPRPPNAQTPSAEARWEWENTFCRLITTREPNCDEGSEEGGDGSEE
jgi:hypothetical protein